MSSSAVNSRSLRTRREIRARQAILLLLCDAKPADFACIVDLSARQWKHLLHWLDTSGLALYFIDRIVELQQTAILPLEVLGLLHRRLTDNMVRTERMIAESAELHHDFQRGGFCYAVLKGFSLWPHSVPKPELRSQLDLDFLVAEESASAARGILEARGYRLCAVSGRSWEFKKIEKPGVSLERLYQDGLCRSVELHVETRHYRDESPLSRICCLNFCGIAMPVLSPADLFLGQGLHLFKHVCSEFSRLAHWVEFRRHVAVRYGDAAFWSRVRSLALANPRASAALGIVILLITRVTEEFAPDALTCWTVDSLPHGARRWVQLYGERAAFTNFPGNKLYLLLQNQLKSSGLTSSRPVWRALLPMRLPPHVLPPTNGETVTARLFRYRTQVWFLFFRFRFHLVQSLGYVRESIRWRLPITGRVR